MKEKKTNFYYKAFLNAFIRNSHIKDPEDIPIEERKKILLMAVKVVGKGRKVKGFDQEILPSIYYYSAELIKTLTFEEFINIFPIKKEYDGEKYESKDYFSTIKYLSDVNKEDKIYEHIDDLLWEYHNLDILLFNVAGMMLMTQEYKEKTGEDLFVKWIKETGQNIATYSEIKDGDKRYLRNTGTGEIMKVKPALPSYLRVIK